MTTVATRLASPEAVVAQPPAGRRARIDAVVRQAAGVLLWLSVLLVTYWWAADRGLQDLGGWAGGLTSLGRLTGLVASVLLLAQVLLMSRVPFLEAAFGQDRLARLHRLVGFTSFNLMLAHIVTITWGYAAGHLTKTPATLWDLTVRYPGMLLAAAGTACLCMVVVTSIRAARRRIRYESWHLLHLYAYVGVGLALPHQLWTGQELVSSTPRTVFWWSAWAAAAASVLLWRVGVPLRRNLRHRLRVTSVVPEANGIVSVYVTGRHLDRLPAEAGQFFSWRFLGRPGWTRANPYSLSAAPDGRSLRITVQAVGDGSHALTTLRTGTRVLVEGPYGRLSARAAGGRRVALIGAGVGITPLRALAEGLPYGPGDATILHRYTDEPLFVHEFGVIAQERGLHVLHLPGQRRSADSWLGVGVGPVDRVDDLAALRYWIPDIADRDVYVCGPEAWTRLVRRTLTAAGLPSDQLHLETFTW
jgi:predicted ferric reductase